MLVLESLETSNREITNSFTLNLVKFEDKLSDARTAVKAQLFSERVEAIKNGPQNLIGFINKLYDKVKVSGKSITEEDSDSIFTKIQLLRTTIYKIDSTLPHNFGKLIRYYSASLDSSELTSEKFYSAFFKGKKNFDNLLALQALKLNMLKTQNSFIAFYNESMSGCILAFTKYAGIVVQNTTILKRGEELEISAGIGSFAVNASPEFTINNKRIANIDNAVASYKVQITKPAGKYSIPVKIEFTSPNGTREIMEREINYTVIQ